jgi:hypothetical protein
LSPDHASAAGRDLLAAVLNAPAVQALRQRVEQGDPLSLEAVAPAAHPFCAVLLRRLFPDRPLVVVTEGLKSQEAVHQDIETWLQLGAAADGPRPRALFYPAWETLPHEAKLPHHGDGVAAADLSAGGNRGADARVAEGGPDRPARPGGVAGGSGL